MRQNVMRCDCPGCGIRIDVADDLPAAKRIRCPECGDRFYLDDIEEARPARKRSRSPRRRQTMNVALIAVPIAIGLLLLVGAGVLALIYWPSQEKKPESAGTPSGGQPGPLPFRPLL